MTRHRVYLFRHAKSSWDDPTLPDRHRPLAPRGIKAAHRMARHVAEAGAAPDLVLCSPAQRAVETLDGIRSALPPTATIVVDDALYTSSADEVLGRLHMVDEDIGDVLVVGHNPATENLAVRLARPGSGDAVDRMRAKFPTAALATLAFHGPWAELSWGQATLESFVVPRDV